MEHLVCTKYFHAVAHFIFAIIPVTYYYCFHLRMWELRLKVFNYLPKFMQMVLEFLTIMSFFLPTIY